MADLLRSHLSVAMGRERYAMRFKYMRKFKPDLFERDRFCTRMEAGDTHHQSLHPYYEDLFGRFHDCTHIGDKIPKIYENYALVNQHYPDCKIVFMVRNIFDVAQSFEIRASKGGGRWPPMRNYSQAVVEWNESLYQTLRMMSHLDLMVVEYEQFYVEPVLLSQLFRFLHLNISAAVHEFWNYACRQRDELEAERIIILGSKQKRHIARFSDFSSYQELLRRKEASVAYA